MPIPVRQRGKLRHGYLAPSHSLAPYIDSTGPAALSSGLEGNVLRPELWLFLKPIT